MMFPKSPTWRTKLVCPPWCMFVGLKCSPTVWQVPWYGEGCSWKCIPKNPLRGSPVMLPLKTTGPFLCK
jgi:hypothetical protein